MAPTWSSRRSWRTSRSRRRCSGRCPAWCRPRYSRRTRRCCPSRPSPNRRPTRSWWSAPTGGTRRTSFRSSRSSSAGILIPLSQSASQPCYSTSASSRCWSTRTSPDSSATGCSTHCGARRSPSSPRGLPTPRPSTWSCATRSACAWARWARSRTPTTWASTSPSLSTTRSCPVLTARPSPTRCCVTSLRQETSAPRPARGSCGGLRGQREQAGRRLAAHVAAQLSRPSD